MKKHLLSIFLFITCAITAQAQETGTLKGIARASDGNPAPYVSVFLKGTTIGTSTDERGTYLLFNVPAGKQTIVFQAIGFSPQEKQVTLQAGTTKDLDITLDETTEKLAEVVVAGQKRRTSTVTKTLTPLENIPISIQLVDKELMQQQQIIDVRDAVKNVSGVTPSGTYNGGYVYYNSRGFDMNNWSNFRRNGMFVWNMGHHFNDNIEQIEILKGPASVLYGDVAPGGVMNFVTKKPLNYDYRRFELKVGQYNLFRPSIDLSGPVNEDGTLLYRFNAAYETSESFRDVVENETVMLAPAFTWKVTPNLTWDIEATYKHDERIGDPGLVSPDGTFEGLKQLPVSTFLGEHNGTYTFDDKSLFSTINYRINEHFTIRNQTYVSYTKRTPYNIYFDGDPDENGNLSRSQYYYHQWWNGYGSTLDFIAELKTGGLTHQALVGVDYMYNGGQWSEGIWETLDTTINIYNPRYGLATLKADPMIWSEFENFYERTGIYFQDQISTLNGQLQLLLGARYNITRQGNEYLDESDAPEGHTIPVNKPISPRVGLVYKPIEQISIYGSYSQSYEMNGQDWIDLTTAIDPTDALQVEFGVKSSLMEDRLGITVSAFQIDKENAYNWIDAVTEPTIDYIAWDEAGQWATYQGGHHRSKGIELDVNGKLFNALTINANYAYIDAEVVEDPAYETGNQLNAAPRNSGSLWLNYAFQNKLKGFELGYGLFYRDEFYLSLANDPNELIDAYYTMDVALGYTYKNLSTRLNITNITDNNGYIGSYGVYEPQWVRRAVLSLAVKF